MKKIYAFLASALMSVSVFAARDVVPSDAVLADYFDYGNVCVCIYVPNEIACNNIVLTGSFNGWSSTVSECVAFEPVEGYYGWYVGSFEPETEPDAQKGIQAKPVMLDVNGNFNWEYQVSAATAIRGSVQIQSGAVAGEIDLLNYGVDAPNVFTIDAWKSTPMCMNNFYITLICDNTKGRVQGAGTHPQNSYATISAIPNLNYHFVQWNDSVTDNPRTLQLTQDTTFTAFFEIDSFYVSISCDTTKGSVDTINGFYPYGAQLNINATPKYGYHFDRWSDNRYSNPRSLTITSNTYLTAIFAKNSYYVHGITNPAQGTISGTGSFLYEDYCTVRAVPNYGYHFVQWSDSVIENPRSFILTKDTMFAAEFAVDTMGTCGKGDALNWVYDAGSKTLVISGDGSFDENMRYGVQAKSNMTQLIIQEGVTAIGESAFAGSEALTTLSLPTSLKRIGDYAFQNCLDLSVIYNHRETPCVISTNTFDGINIFDCTLLVPAGSLAMYKHEVSNWHIFYFIDTFGEDSTSLYIVNYLDKDSINIVNEIVKLHFPQAPEIEGFTFLGWRPVSSIIVDEIAVQAIYQSNTQGNAPAEVTTLSNPAQKLVREGNVYILRGEKVYTLQGQEVK